MSNCVYACRNIQKPESLPTARGQLLSQTHSKLSFDFSSNPLTARKQYGETKVHISEHFEIWTICRTVLFFNSFSSCILVVLYAICYLSSFGVRERAIQCLNIGYIKVSLFISKRKISQAYRDICYPGYAPSTKNGKRLLNKSHNFRIL